MTRPLNAQTSAALAAPILPLAAIVRLDILNDPVYAWTGIGDIAFAGTGDTALDGLTFAGVSSVVSISTLSDAVGGSPVLELSMAGVDPTLPAFRQVIYDRRTWQFRRAWVWLVVLDPDTGAVVGTPFRIKTGRIDQMPYTEDKATGGTIACRIEGQQSYGGEALGSRYMEAEQINAQDTSNKFVFSLANLTASIGKASAAPAQLTYNPPSGGGGTGRGYGNYDDR
jgi:hypothetical protein